MLSLSFPCIASAQGSIPKAQGTTLAGNSVTLPDALKGKAGVLVVGFSHSSQAQVTEWGKRLAADYQKSPDVEYFEVPMLGGAPKILRGIIIKKMGSTVPEPERPHFLPLTDDDKPWRTLAHYKVADDAYVLLVDGQGTVRWMTEGSVTDGAYSELKRNLEGLTSPNTRQ